MILALLKKTLTTLEIYATITVCVTINSMLLFIAQAHGL